MRRNGGISSPAALPRSSWGGTLKRTVSEFKDDKLQHWAAALTYYAVLSIFPALLVMVSLVGLFGDPAQVTRVLTDTVSQLGPGSAADTFSCSPPKRGLLRMAWVNAPSIQMIERSP